MQPSSPSPLSERIRAAGAALEIAPTHIVALLVLASCACAGVVALWWTARPDVTTQASMPTGLTPSAGPTDVSGASTAPQTAVVHVSGAVVSGGVYELASGSRVVDAIDAAGGPRDGARTEQLNLARVVQDGEQVHVPDAADVRSAGPVAGSATSDAPGATAEQPGRRVALNAASEDELETLPGVGPVLAGRIVAHRERTGGFSTVEDLLAVDGIGEKTFAQLRDLVTP